MSHSPAGWEAQDQHDSMVGFLGRALFLACRLPSSCCIITQGFGENPGLFLLLGC